MAKRIAINGFGRIGRLVLRALIESDNQDFVVVAINDLAPAESLARLLKFDSVHGRFPKGVTSNEKTIFIEDKPISIFSERDPSNLPWKDLGVDIVMECTGFFLTSELAQKHIDAGAKRVLLSAPPKDNTKTTVYGINHNIINKDDIIVSNASCTTNALAPLLYILDRELVIQSGFMTTIHAYTGDQPTHDSVHKDPYRGRSATLSMIPTTTGAAKTISKILPHLDGKLDGMALRVPTPNVSAVDLTFMTEKKTTKEAIRQYFKDAANNELKGIMGYVDEKMVSSDFNHDPHSTSFVADQIFVNKDNMMRVFSWYDNEWGFSNRMIDTARVIAGYI